jgi:hypothetical protein
VVDGARRYLQEEQRRVEGARREVQRRAALSDDDKLREVIGLAPDHGETEETLRHLKDGGYHTVEALAHEEDLGRLASSTGLSENEVEGLRHAALVWLGERPPEGGGGAGRARAHAAVDEGWGR